MILLKSTAELSKCMLAFSAPFRTMDGDWRAAHNPRRRMQASQRFSVTDLPSISSMTLLYVGQDAQDAGQPDSTTVNDVQRVT